MKNFYKSISGFTLLALLLVTTNVLADPGDTARVSVDSLGAQANSYSYSPDISSDGRYVAFYSHASNLVAGDTNGMDDVFVHDRITGTTMRVSVDSLGSQGNSYSYSPSISSDGRYVAFQSYASNLVDGDTNATPDVFVHDRITGTTMLVSMDSLGTQGNSYSYSPSISADGRYVAFHSVSSNLVNGDTNAKEDVFVHDRTTATTTLVSVDAGGTQGNGSSFNPSISSDGRYIAFDSLANNLVVGDTNGEQDVFVYDRTIGATTRVSVDSLRTQGNGYSFSSSISPDGRYVAFSSFASNLVVGDTNGEYDIFVHDCITGTTTLVSVDSSGTKGNDYSFSPSISSEGHYVAFISNASNLVAGDTNGVPDVFVHDRTTGITMRVSVDSLGTQGNSNSSFYSSISADGRFVAFISDSTNLVNGDTNGVSDVFVHEQFAAPWIGSVSISSDKNIVAVGRPHIGSEIASYDGFSTGSLTAYVPMLFKNAYGGTYDSALYIQNVDATLATLSIKYYTSAGVLTCTVSGETIAPLASKGYWLPSVSCLPDGWVGGAVITSDKNIVANGRPHIGTEVMTYDSFSSGSLTSYLPMLFKNAYGGSYDSAFYVQNVDTTNTANLTIKYYDSAGALTCTASDTVAPFASKGYWLPGLAASCLPDGWVGGVVVTSTQPIVSVGRPHVGTQITTYNGFSAGAGTSYVPMLFKNAFGGSYDAAFYVQNVGASAATISIKYYDLAGNLTCTVPDSVAPLAAKGYWLPGLPASCLPDGWIGGAVVTSNVDVVAIGRPHIGAQVTTYDGFTSGSLTSYLPMLFKDAYGGSYDSAYYIQNTEASTANVLTKFYDSTGALTCTRSDTLAPFSTLSLWLPSLTCMP